MLKLFCAAGSCARASHIALREADADFELYFVDFANAEQRTESYKEVNPKGRVPALQTDRGVISETPAILAYIAQSHPAAKLAPLDDPFEFARMQSFASYLCATVHVAHAHARRGERWADDVGAINEMKRKAPQVYGECFQLIEDELLAGPWVMGADYSVVDAYLFTVTQWLAFHKIDSQRYPKVHDHMSRMLARPAVQATLDAEAAGA